jgi:DNA-3-methyladenine glycosylase II
MRGAVSPPPRSRRCATWPSARSTDVCSSGVSVRLSDEAVIEHLVQVRGIGEWSAQMFLLFRLGRLDVMAPGDLGLQEGLRILDELEERPTPRELAARAEAWRPLRSVASWTLWRIVEHERKRLAAPKARGRSG